MCVFCDRINNDEYILRHNDIFVLVDKYPVTEGHALIVPIRCIKNFFYLTPNEERDIHTAIHLYCDKLAETGNDDIDGYNIGWNCGGSAGQTIEHAHCHLIPRRTGDCENPVGGVRNVIPEMGDYING